jgi:predicted TIM-barrel fold metal-dependent hydrolase
MPSRVIDAHNHIGDISLTGAVAQVDDARPSAGDGGIEGSGAGIDLDMTDRLEALDRSHVDQAVIIGAHGHLRPEGIADTRRVNDTVAAYRDRRPDRFPAAIGIVEPLYGERGLDEIDRCAQELGLAGISFHTRFQGVTNNSPWVRRYIGRMGELGLVVYMHAVGESAAESLWKVEVVAQDFPDVTFVVLDGFSTFEQSMMVPYVAERTPNLVFDTATCHGWGFMAPLVARCGASRLAYGSDLHSGEQGRLLYDPLPDIVAADLPDDDRRAILGGNIARILGLE